MRSITGCLALGRLVRKWLVVPLPILLLPAVPVSALTLLGSWRIQQNRESGAPLAQVTQDPIPGIGSLIVNMGLATRPGAAHTFTAVRDFRVGPGGETVKIAHVFESLLQDTKCEVLIRVVGAGSTPDPNFVIPTMAFNRERGLPAQAFSANDTFMNALAAGNYRILVRVKYKNRNGSWDNSKPAPGSPHSFTLQSL